VIPLTLLLISALGISFIAASATEIPVYCWPEGSGFLLKKWRPVVCTAQVV
jgi:hypothetical protein